MKSTIGLIAITRTECKISGGPLRTFIICLSGARRLTTRSRGWSARTRWNVCTLTPSSKYYLTLCSTKYMIVLIELQPINMDVKRKKKFVLTVTVWTRGKHTRRILPKGSHLDCPKMRVCTGTRSKCTSTLV